MSGFSGPRTNTWQSTRRHHAPGAVAELTLHDARGVLASQLLLYATPDELFAGRGPDCELQADDHSLSWRHARLEWDGSTLLIHDLASKNGTWVAGRRVSEPVRLGLGGTVRFGHATARLGRVQLGDRASLEETLRLGGRARWHAALVVLAIASLSAALLGALVLLGLSRIT
jgi:hypothetical protein